jgi:hypothetical protein
MFLWRFILKFNKKVVSFFLASSMVLSGNIFVFASDLISDKVIISTSVDTAQFGNPGDDPATTRSSDLNNNVTSNVSKVKTSNGYYATGWVTLTDKQTGVDTYHYSNAAMEDRSGYYTIVHAESGRQWGKGRVAATSPVTSVNCGAYIYWGY